MGQKKQGEVWIARLDPTVGREIKKTRPCLIVSPDDLNHNLGTVVVAPISSKQRDWPFRPSIEVGRISGDALLDQMRVLDKSRLLNRVAVLDDGELVKVLQLIRDMYA